MTKQDEASRLNNVLSGVASWLDGLKPASPKALFQSATRGLPLAVAAVPDGMASATLVGVSPIHGLYAGFAGPLFGGLFTSSRLMVVATTSAASLAALSALQGVSGDDLVPSLVLLTMLSGVFMLIGGWIGAGRLTKFVSESVMTGFLTGVGINIILSQIPDLTGAETTGSNSLFKAIDLLLHPGLADGMTTLLGVGCLIALVVLERTAIGSYTSLLVMIAASVVVATVGAFSDVTVVSDVSAIESGFPPIQLPDLSFITFDLVAGAFAVAAIVMVQSAAVGQSYPNPDGKAANVDADFTGQGWANLATGLFRGIPVGGSVGSTAMSVNMGDNSRWAAITSGIWMLAVLVAFSSQAEIVAMPALGAILMVASAGAVVPSAIKQIWRAGWLSRIAMVSTFLAVLFLPVATAVAVGVALSMLLNVGSQAAAVEVVEIFQNEDGELAERPIPQSLESDSLIVLNVYGSLFFAGARAISEMLPAVGDATNATVIIRLRGRDQLGATAMSVLTDYAESLREHGGRLWMSGIDPELVEQLVESGRLDLTDEVEIYPATDTIGESTRRAIADAKPLSIAKGPTHGNQSPAPLSHRLTRQPSSQATAEGSTQ